MPWIAHSIFCPVIGASSCENLTKLIGMHAQAIATPLYFSLFFTWFGSADQIDQLMNSVPHKKLFLRNHKLVLRVGQCNFFQLKKSIYPIEKRSILIHLLTTHKVGAMWMGEARDEMHLLLINRRPSNTIPTLIVPRQEKEKVIYYARDEAPTDGQRERPMRAARNN